MVRHILPHSPAALPSSLLTDIYVREAIWIIQSSANPRNDLTPDEGKDEKIHEDQLRYPRLEKLSNQVNNSWFNK
jgi:hypothetical protein